MKKWIWLSSLVIILILFDIAVIAFLLTKTRDFFQCGCFPLGIVLHHSAGAGDARSIDEWHKIKGFGILYQGKEYHIAYHYVILPDGRIQKGRPERCKGAHVDKPFYNNFFLGICLIGNFSSSDNPDGRKGPKKPTPAQLRSLKMLIQELKKKYPVLIVKSHREINPDTECPGDTLLEDLLMKRGYMKGVQNPFGASLFL